MLETIQNGVLLVVFAVGGIWAFSILLPAVVAMFERRLVWPYGEAINESPHTASSDENLYAAPAAEPDVIPLNHYASEKTRDAKALGFKLIDRRRHSKGGIYRIRHDFWRSPDGIELLMISWGSLAAIPVQGIWVFTRFADGTVLTTIDSAAGSEYDLTGLSKERLVRPGQLREQLSEHRRQSMLRQSTVIPYSRDQPLEEHRADRIRRYRQLVETGYAKYVDLHETEWRYTLTGALYWSMRNWMRGMRRSIKADD